MIRDPSSGGFAAIGAGLLLDPKHWKAMPGQTGMLYALLVFWQANRKDGLVDDGRPVPLAVIVKATGATKSGVMKMLNRLEEGGYIKRKATPTGSIIRIVRPKSRSQNRSLQETPSVHSRKREGVQEETQGFPTGHESLTPGNASIDKEIRTKKLEETREAPPYPPKGDGAQGTLIEMPTREPERWAAWAHPMDAFEDIAAIWPKRRELAKAKDHWSKTYAKRPTRDGAETGQRIWEIAQYVAQRWPAHKINFLPDLYRFVRTAWQDDWEQACAVEAMMGQQQQNGGLSRAKQNTDARRRDARAAIVGAIQRVREGDRAVARPDDRLLPGVRGGRG